MRSWMRFIPIMLVLLGACAEGYAPSGDAGVAASPLYTDDVQTLLSTLLATFNQFADVSCPCQVEMGSFPSSEACKRVLGYSPAQTECVTTAAASFDSEGLRGEVRCQLERMQAINACLLSSVCTDSLACYESAPMCPMTGLEAASAVLMACPDAATLAR